MWGLVSYFMACSYPSSYCGMPLYSDTPCIDLELRDHPSSHSALAEFGCSLSLAYTEALWGLIRRGRTRWSARIPRSISRVCLAFYYLHHSSPILRNHTHHVYSAGPPVSGYTLPHVQPKMFPQALTYCAWGWPLPAPWQAACFPRSKCRRLRLLLW